MTECTALVRVSWRSRKRILIKVKTQLYLCTPWRYRGRGGKAPFILNFGTKRMLVINFTSWPLYPPRKSRLHQMNVWATNSVLTERIFCPRTETRYLGHPVHGLVIIQPALRPDRVSVQRGYILLHACANVLRVRIMCLWTSCHITSTYAASP
jgi:hypothetical protein